MSFITDTLFGEKPKTYSPGKLIRQFTPAYEQVTQGLTEGVSTPYSNVNPFTGQSTIDPTGRNLNLGALDTYIQNLGSTRSSLLGNQGAYQQARVRPLAERLALGRGQLQRGLGQTGVRGTFANRALQNYDIQGERALGDARALAQSETLNALSQLDQALFEGQTGVGQNLFNQELASLGLNVDFINNLRSIAANLSTGAGSNAVSSQNAANQANQARAAAIRTFAGSLLAGGLGGFGGGGAATGNVVSGGSSGYLGSMGNWAGL